MLSSGMASSPTSLTNYREKLCAPLRGMYRRSRGMRGEAPVRQGEGLIVKRPATRTSVQYRHRVRQLLARRPAQPMRTVVANLAVVAKPGSSFAASTSRRTRRRTPLATRTVCRSREQECQRVVVRHRVECRLEFRQHRIVSTLPWTGWFRGCGHSAPLQGRTAAACRTRPPRGLKGLEG